MPRNQQDSKDTDNGNSDEGREFRGPAVDRVILVGRLASDPELRYKANGSAVTQLRLATNEAEESQFHTLSALSKLAEFAGSHLKKGRLLYIEGRLYCSSWQAADGSQRGGCEVRVSNLQVLDQRPQPSRRPEGEGQ
jgi:single-strand DNA-binding protein